MNYPEAYGIYGCNGLLFNHESPRRGATFVTRKITHGLANIAQGLDSCLFMGNIDSRRDWGHAKDYGRMQWLTLQQNIPEDYVIATGEQYSVREFICWSTREIGIEIEFRGARADEVGVVLKVQGELAPAVRAGDIIVRIDPRYLRPTEIDTLLGDPSTARERRGWVPTISAHEMCAEMVGADLKVARRHRLLREHGLDLPIE